MSAIRPEYTAMQEDVGCPECHSVNTVEDTVSINGYDGVDISRCDDCGHVEVKYYSECDNGK